MKPDPLPAEFVTWIKAYVLSAQFTSVRRLHRGLILRWGFWLDGTSDNKLPGYTTCPKPDSRTDQPAGWSYQKFHAIAKEAIGTARVHAARAAAARIDCGSGYDYGICPKCNRGHGHVLIANGQPTALVTNS